jgi:hypothetical protein
MYLKEADLDKIDFTKERTQTVNRKERVGIVHRYVYTFHCFRHTMACIIYYITGDIYAVNRFLGHKQLDTTMVYAKMTDKKMKDMVSRVHASQHGHRAVSEPSMSRISLSQPKRDSPLEALKRQLVDGRIDEETFIKKKELILC